MLHILFFIIKIIGIILAVMIGLVILCIGILLFSPIKYDAEIEKYGSLKSIKASVKVSWIFKLFDFKMCYEKGKMSYQFRAAFKKWTKEEEKGAEKHEETVFQTHQYPDDENEVLSENETVFNDTEKKNEEGPTISRQAETSAAQDEKRSKTNYIGKIKCTLKKIYDKINVLREKKDQVMEFLHQKEHSQAIRFIKKEGVRLAENISPRIWNADITAGFEDPYDTGKMLAGFSVVYPFIGDHITICPDFEHQIFEGKIDLKGNLRICHFAATGLRLLISKNIRITLKDFNKLRKREQEED